MIDDEDIPYMRRLDKYFDELSAITHRSVDLLVYTVKEFEDGKRLPFLNRVLKDAVVIYERREDPA